MIFPKPFKKILTLILTATFLLSTSIPNVSVSAYTDPKQPNPSKATLQKTVKLQGLPGKDYIADEIIVKYRKGADKEKIHGKAKAKLKRKLLLKNCELVKVDKGVSLEEALQTLINDPDVIYAEPNHIRKPLFIPNDPWFIQQWASNKIMLSEAWDVTMGSSDVKIAIIDTGIDLDHPDLEANIVPGMNFIEPGAPPEDDNNHGTHVAGIAAALTNNGIGVAGVAGNSKILPVKVMDASGTAGYVTDGIIWAVDHGAKVINLSIGGGFDYAEMDAVNYAHSKGVVIVAAAGNESSNVEYPAALNHVIGVSSTNCDDVSSIFTNYGPEIDVSAPGSGIVSTFPPGTYQGISGTSMASPHVAGLAALILSKYPNLTPDEVERRIEMTADDLGTSGFDEYYGHGRINTYRALSTLDYYEPNDILAEAKEETIGTTVSGAIYPENDIDIFKFNVTGNRVKVSLRVPAGIDGKVEVLNEAGEVIYTIDSAGTGANELAYLNLSSAGSYYFKITDKNGGSSNTDLYGLEVTEVDAYEPNDTFAEAALLSITDGIETELSGMRSPELDDDFFKIEVPETGTVTVTLQYPPYMYGTITLYDGNHNEVAKAVDEATLSSIVNAGTYYIKISGYFTNIWSYNLKVGYYKDIHEPNGTMGQARTINIGETVYGKINPVGDEDYFKVTAPEAGTIMVTFKNPPTMGGEAMIYDGSGNELGLYHYIGVGQERLMLINTLQPGSYYFKIFLHEATEKTCSQNYSLTYEFVNDIHEWNDVIPPWNDELLQFDVPVYGSISPAGDVDYHRVAFGQAGIADITLTPPAGMDGVVGLYDSLGNEVAVKNSNGTGAQETLSTYVQAQTYYVKVSDAGGIETTEKYSLTVSFDLDSIPPTGTVIANSGQKYTSSATIPLTINATDNSGTINRMRIICDDEFGPWTSYQSSTEVTLPPGEGPKHIYVAVEDEWNYTVLDGGIVYLDTQKPTAKLTTPFYSTNTSKTKSFNVSWSGTDASGIASYDVQYKVGGTTKWVTWKTNTTLAKASFTGSAGKNYYFRVRAKDKSGKLGDWTTAAYQTLVPYDNNSYYTRSGFGKTYTNSGSNHYLGTLRYSTRAKESLTYKVTGNRIALIGYKGPGRSKVKIYVDGVYKGTFDTYSATGKYRQVIYSTSWSKAGTHTIKIVNVGTSRRTRLDVDGMAVGR